MAEKLPILKQGHSGTHVQRLQNSLVNWSLFPKESVDGKFGPGTAEKVKDFQNLRLTQDKCKFSPTPLAPTGEVDKNTWAELLELAIDAIEILEAAAGLVTADQAAQIFGTSVTDSQLTDLNFCLSTFEINTPERIRQFVAQIAHESGGLQYMQEIASGEDYEGRDDLGNTEPGDGPKYKGAGALQLTGRANYQRLADFLKDPKVMDGVDYVGEKYPFTSGGFWWHDNAMNSYVDGGATCRQVSTRVNGADPANGLEDREAYYATASQVITG